MVSQSWDGKRLYFSSSLLARWDKQGDDNEQFVRAYHWDGQALTPAFELDFMALKLGRPHHMLLRVFLVDRAGNIRNIYSSGTLDLRLVLADIQTLLLEERSPTTH